MIIHIEDSDLDVFYEKVQGVYLDNYVVVSSDYYNDVLSKTDAFNEYHINTNDFYYVVKCHDKNKKYLDHDRTASYKTNVDKMLLQILYNSKRILNECDTLIRQSSFDQKSVKRLTNIKTKLNEIITLLDCDYNLLNIKVYMENNFSVVEKLYIHDIHIDSGLEILSIDMDKIASSIDLYFRSLHIDFMHYIDSDQISYRIYFTSEEEFVKFKLQH